MIDVTIEKLPLRGADWEERVVISEKGTMVQVLNRTDETFKQLVYWDIDSAKTGVDRGHHFHLKKVDRLYVVSGEIDVLLEDRETGEKDRVTLTPGMRITIPPGIAHAVRSRSYAQVLEYGPEPYDPSDTYPFRVTMS